MAVSAVVLTYNDRDTISDCLDGVEWCDELIIVDSYSSDGTETIIQERGDIVCQVEPAEEGEPFDHFRRIGFKKASNDWIIAIDADEVMPTALAERLEELASKECAQVIWAPRKNLFKDRWLDGGYWWPAYTPRLVHRSVVTVTDDVHDFYSFAADADNLQLPPAEEFAVVHQKADSYREAFQTARRHAKIRAKQEEFQPSKLGAFFYTFWKFYIDSQSYRDGVPGLLLSAIHAMYRMEAILRSAQIDG